MGWWDNVHPAALSMTLLKAILSCQESVNSLTSIFWFYDVFGVSLSDWEIILSVTSEKYVFKLRTDRIQIKNGDLQRERERERDR